MATTKIWDVSAHVSKLLAYVANKNKTVMEIENKNFDESERLAAEILGLPYDHFTTEEMKFVTHSDRNGDGATVSFDTEGADRYEETTLMGHKAFLVVEGETVFLLWFNADNKRVYTLSTDCMDTYDIWRLAEKIASGK